ncbi:DMT family transporter [Sulfitobacter sp. KE34]|uniref:DMT family transporter n=1 Tax=Sulfitobacter faviae TaxID=1775881 RepID=A0AAX3LPW7_9RHOB|nr:MULTISPECIES: DMT family transporter [Sulfitobacter]MDF3351719.1 DMT family transporter [Sulfitobacter sp. KE12]MDF3355391.1 DMT family transporter [Sulfitobacter sp. KE27]MDF3359039.1 DMT family transporter [Sulfitobacter sp. KE33]MDF3361417.1 DMT family transporter [Sulfitobacter sp. Ks41]MDF3366463.1 DMT family transporter [Sulfitobacter sp. Ks34]
MQRAIPIMFIAMSLIPAGDSAGKILTSGMGVAPVFVAWSRFAIGALMVLPFLPRGTWGLMRDWRLWLRAGTLALGITCIQTALRTEAIANVFAAFFIGPMISYLLAAIFLRERISLLRSALILLGFCGVLLVVRPGLGGGTGGPGLLFAVAAGLFYGVFLTMSRWLSDLAPPLALTFTQLAMSAMMLLPLGLMNLPEATLPVAGLATASALFSMLGNLLLLYAYRRAPATRLAPLVYFQLIAAVLLGLFLFSTLPDALTWAGLAVIITAGITSARLR